MARPLLSLMYSYAHEAPESNELFTYCATSFVARPRPAPERA
jgi:hypothetical protein